MDWYFWYWFWFPGFLVFWYHPKLGFDFLENLATEKSFLKLPKYALGKGTLPKIVFGQKFLFSKNP
jgi:hypothetical protein